jgi:hypothetical protein
MLTKKVLMYRIMSEGVVSGRKLRDLPDTKKGPLSANGPLFYLLYWTNGRFQNYRRRYRAI